MVVKSNSAVRPAFAFKDNSIKVSAKFPLDMTTQWIVPSRSTLNSRQIVPLLIATLRIISRA